MDVIEKGYTTVISNIYNLELKSRMQFRLHKSDHPVMGQTPILVLASATMFAEKSQCVQFE